MDDSLARRHSETRGPTVLGLSISFTVFSTICVLLRVYTRRVILHTFGLEDAAIVIAQILSICVTVTTGLQVLWGLGRHSEFIAIEIAIKAMKGQYAIVLMYNAAQTITKISFLLQYRRLFPTGRVHNICGTCLILLVIWGVAQQFIVAFACNPLLFLAPQFAGKCIDEFIVFNTTSCMNILTDFMIFLLPIVPILRLNMPMGRKGVLLLLFSLGLFACVISIIRLTELHAHHGNSDPSYESAAAAYWSTVELNVGIMCASLPTLRPLLKKYVPGLMGSSAPESGAHAYGVSHASHRLSTFKRTHRAEPEDKVYMQKGEEFHSTTELKIEDTRASEAWLDGMSTKSREGNGTNK